MLLFVIGMFVGAFIGVIVLSLMIMSKNTERWRDR